ncbi:hypothetical protein Kisp01_71590 [Kineosporia sp. NBRC 101677]|nr:hypothetical protein Kisp01_71590 [Kineosporia sp. NBRC 101677]
MYSLLHPSTRPFICGKNWHAWLWGSRHYANEAAAGGCGASIGKATFPGAALAMPGNSSGFWREET